MIQDLVGKLVVIEFERTGNTNQRTIARLIDVRDGLVELESPSTKNRYVINTKTVVEINELPPNRVRPELVAP